MSCQVWQEFAEQPRRSDEWTNSLSVFLILRAQSNVGALIVWCSNYRILKARLNQTGMYLKWTADKAAEISKSEIMSHACSPLSQEKLWLQRTCQNKLPWELPECRDNNKNNEWSFKIIGITHCSAFVQERRGNWFSRRNESPGINRRSLIIKNLNMNWNKCQRDGLFDRKLGF